MATKSWTEAFFKKYDYLFEMKPINCGPVAFHKLLIDMPVKDFCQMAVDKKGVLLLPAEMYERKIAIISGSDHLFHASE